VMKLLDSKTMTYDVFKKFQFSSATTSSLWLFNESSHISIDPQSCLRHRYVVIQ
jgi:hypothetical protein